MKIEFYRHNLSAADKKEASKTLDSIFLTSGAKSAELEKRLAGYVGSRFSVGLTSCTSALELALRYFGIGPGDEVITTPLSFIATANVIEYCGARPVFVDAEDQTGNINAELIEGAVTRKTKVILPVHLYGQMCDMRRIKVIADRHKLRVVEDAAHCIEGIREGVRPGQLGDCAAFSFYATKNITCGEGGAIACNSARFASWLHKARLHGMSKDASSRYTAKYRHYDMEFLGFKCNMNNIQAALLVHQLERIERLLLARERIAVRYDEAFGHNPAIRMPEVLPKTRHARHLYTIWVDPRKRDRYLAAFQDAGIGVAVNFRPITLMKYYRDKYGYRQGDFPTAERIGGSTISLPFYPRLTQKEIAYVIEQVNRITGKQEARV